MQAVLDIFLLQLCGDRIFGGRGRQHVPGVAQVPPAQQQAGILFTVPLEGAHLQTAVLLQPIQVQLDRRFDLCQAFLKIIRLADERPVELADTFGSIFWLNIAQNDGDDPFVVLCGPVDFHLTHFRGDGIRADHKNECVGFLDAAEDLFEPVHGRRDGLPVHPDVLVDGPERLDQVSGCYGIFPGIRDK